MKKIIICLIVLLVSAIFLSGCTVTNDNNLPTGVDNNQIIVGGDKDTHGCIGSAGYVWNNDINQCVRPWEYLDNQAKSYCDKNDIESAFVCDKYIGVVSSLDGAGITYYTFEGKEINCPVVSPDSMSEECKQILAINCAQVNVCEAKDSNAMIGDSNSIVNNDSNVNAVDTNSLIVSDTNSISVLDTNTIANMPNPASVYCIDQNGTIDIRQDVNGNEQGFCILDNNVECDEWAYFRNECPVDTNNIDQNQ